LLQTVQGSKLVADNALSRPDGGSNMRAAMEQLSEWLGQASTEGRAAVHALRAPTGNTDDLPGAFRSAIEECRRDRPIAGSVSVNGAPRGTHPLVRDELYRIGYEAIRNACIHSKGSRVHVDLTYGQDLVLRVTDDGVGIDVDVASQGKTGHFGVAGMRERAAKLGATLALRSSTEGGTELLVSLPGRMAFKESGRLARPLTKWLFP
jgi:signal transduction histidine kinase